MKDNTMHTLPMKRPTLAGILFILCFGSAVVMAQGQPDTKKNTSNGELENVEIEIVKDREITLPKADRNFEKIPPRPAGSIRPNFTYDFQSFNFQAPLITPQARPLKLKTESTPDVFGGFLRAGYGNYASPLLEAYINNRKDKNKLIGAHLFHSSSGKGPVDGKNSGSGTTSVSLFGKSFSEDIALSGNVDVENRTTHFYGYPAGSDVDKKSIKQSYNRIKLGGEVSNARNSDFAYKLGAGFSYLSDKYDARETEFDVDFGSSYEMDEDSKINLRASYAVISRKDASVEAKPRSLFTVAPSYAFSPVEDLKLSVGAIAAFENDSIDSKNVHLYPDVRATYPVSPSVDFVASLSGGIEKVSLQTLSNENIWLAPNVPIFHTNKTVDLGLGINARLGNKVSAHTGISVASLKNWYFFRNTAADVSKFDVLYDDGATKRTNFYAALGYAQTETAKFLLRGDLYSYSTDALAEAWHRPTYKLTANASFNVYQKLLFNIDLIAQGGMKAQDPVTEETIKLKGAFDLNFKAEYLFSESFSAFLQFNNVTSSKYPVFLNYPVRGFQMMAGVTWSF